MLGSQTAFKEAAQLVERLLLLRVSENTVRHETQRYGQLQQEREAQWQQESQDMERLIARRRTLT
ncbi:MAG: hypothetical protein GWN58_23895, partial [Anaerolineae bacterium]|nr:hypothetical protein [Anaerolineae bacterium]